MAAPKLPGGEFSLGTIAQIAIRARDFERAVRFYRDIARLPLLHREGDMAFFDADGVRLLVAVPQQAELDRPSSILYFQVAEIRAAYQALVERGVHFTAPPRCIAELGKDAVWLAFFRDSEGNLLAIMGPATN